MRKIIFTLCLFALSLAGARAALLFSDAFSYPDGAITNVSGGVWIEDSGTNDAANALLVTNGQAQISRSRTEQVHAALNQANSTGGGIVLYCGFTMNMGGGYFLDYGTGSQRCKVFSTVSNAAPGYYRLNVGNATSSLSASSQCPNDLAPGTAYTVVTRYNVDTGVSTLWINPAAESDSSVTAADAPSPTTISSIHLRQAGSMGIMLIDNLKVGTTFADAVGGGTQAPAFTAQPQDQTATETGGATFTAAASGLPAPAYQWFFNGTNGIPNATNAALTLTNVQFSQAGNYSVTASNSVNHANSAAAALTVVPIAPLKFTVLTYNTGGNGTTDWSTNAAQVQAIGRELAYLQPDVLTLNEIPNTNAYQMTNWVAAYLPGYYLAVSPTTDGFLRNAILSRYPIIASNSYLHNGSLTNYDATVTNGFTRDLFEAQINLPGVPRTLHAFCAHLKSTGSTAGYDAARRAAEASAVSNFFATVFLPTNGADLYFLAGDMNEDVNRSSFTNHPIQRLANAATGLQLSTPVNPVNGDDRTWSIQSGLTERLDYVFPGGALASNIVFSQVFRTDLLSPLPLTLNANDDSVASDHLPALMTFANPFSAPFKLLSFSRTNQSVALRWESMVNRFYNLETSSNLANWTILASNLLSTGSNLDFSTNNLADPVKFLRVRRLP